MSVQQQNRINHLRVVTDVVQPADLTARQRDSLDRADRTRDLFALAATAEAKERHRLHEQIVVDHMGVARSLAGRYRGKGIDTEDLVQVANVGLIKAVAGCDPERGGEFMKYAVTTILGELKRHFRDRGWAIRPTRQIQELHASVRAARNDLVQTLGREPNQHELATATGADVGAIREAEQAGQLLQIASLEKLIGGDAVFTDIPDESTDLEQVDNHLLLQQAVTCLTDRERAIIRMRFVEECTQAEIGEQLGLSQMHISRLIRDILLKLRHSISGGQQLAG